MQQGIGRRWLVLTVVAVGGLAFAALAGGVIKNKTFSSGTVDKEFGDSDAEHDASPRTSRSPRSDRRSRTSTSGCGSATPTTRTST